MDYAQVIYSTAKGEGFSDTLSNNIVAQARHETGNFKSNAFLKHNNAFGYSYVKDSPYQTNKQGLVADNKRPVADYATVADSTRELIAWLKRREREGKLVIAKMEDPAEYAAALKRNGYFTDKESTYLSAMKKWLAESKVWYEQQPKYQQMLIQGGIGLVGVTLISAFVYSMYRYFKK